MTGAGPTSAAIVLLWGEDAFLLREAALELLEDVRPVEVEAGEWGGGEMSNLSTPSLFGDRRALLVAASRSLPAAAIEEISEYADHPSPDARLILCAQVPERGKAPAALVKLVKGRGEIVEVNVGRRDLAGWLVERARAGGRSLAPEAARALVETVGESPAALAGALDQLAAAYPGERLTGERARSQFRGLGDQRVWDLCDRLFARDVPASIRSLWALLEGREDPIFILGAVASRLRDLVRVRALPDRTPPQEVAKAAGLRYEWQARRYRDQARRFEMDELLSLHERVVQADRDLKSGAPGAVVLAALATSVAR